MKYCHYKIESMIKYSDKFNITYNWFIKAVENQKSKLLK